MYVEQYGSYDMVTGTSLVVADGLLLFGTRISATIMMAWASLWISVLNQHYDAMI